jgi:hypothetical protein
MSADDDLADGEADVFDFVNVDRATRINVYIDHVLCAFFLLEFSLDYVDT